jgi:hypothetical protein
MGPIPQKWLFACGDCGCIFTTMAEKQTGIMPNSESTTIDRHDPSLPIPTLPNYKLKNYY